MGGGVSKSKVSSISSAATWGDGRKIIDILGRLGPRDKFALLNSEDVEGKKPIYHAAECDNHNEVIVMLASLQEEDRLSVLRSTIMPSALHCAVMNNAKASASAIIRCLNEDQIKEIIFEEYRGSSILQLSLHRVRENSIIPIILLKLSEEDRISLIKHQDTEGETVLHQAAREGSLQELEQICEYLLPEEFREILLYKSQSGITPLHYAASRGYIKIINFILDSFEDKRIILEQKTLELKTPLHFAAEVQNLKVISHILEILGDNQARIQALKDETCEGKSVLEIAEDKGYLKGLAMICGKFGLVIEAPALSKSFPEAEVEVEAAAASAAHASSTKEERSVVGVVFTRRDESKAAIEDPDIAQEEERRSFPAQESAEETDEDVVRYGSQTHSEAEAAGGSKSKLEASVGAPTLAAAAVAAEELAQAKAAAAEALGSADAAEEGRVIEREMIVEAGKWHHSEKERVESGRSPDGEFETFKPPSAVSFPPSPEAAAGFIRDKASDGEILHGAELLGSD